MKWHGVSVYNHDFIFTLPRLYTENEWKYGTYYIYENGSWKMVGGACTQMLEFLTNNGSNVQNNGNTFLVRQPIGIQSLTDSNSQELLDAHSEVLYVN